MMQQEIYGSTTQFQSEGYANKHNSKKGRKFSHAVENQVFSPTARSTFENRSSSQMPALSPKQRLMQVPTNAYKFDYFTNNMGMDEVSTDGRMASLPAEGDLPHNKQKLYATATAGFGRSKRSEQTPDPFPAVTNRSSNAPVSNFRSNKKNDFVSIEDLKNGKKQLDMNKTMH